MGGRCGCLFLTAPSARPLLALSSTPLFRLSVSSRPLVDLPPASPSPQLNGHVRVAESTTNSLINDADWYRRHAAQSPDKKSAMLRASIRRYEEVIDHGDVSCLGRACESGGACGVAGMAHC